MATKLGRKELPAGHTAEDFEVVGRAAKTQNDFGNDVGVADMACVNQFGETNNSKYYHAAVIKSRKNGSFFTYFEWGRNFSGKSWEGGFRGPGDFMVTECSGESEAREVFAKQCAEKNTKRGEFREVAGAQIWSARAGKDGYIVQDLATRQRGLPDAYKIKDSAGITPAPKKDDAEKPAKKASAPTKKFDPMVVSLATALVGGVKSYTKAMSAAAGVSPTKASIDMVRNIYIPAALNRLKKVGDDIQKQIKDTDLQDISKAVAASVPREVPRGVARPEMIILNQGNITVLQQDLDAFESALSNESFEVEETTSKTVDPDTLLNAKLTWLDPSSAIGKWVVEAYMGMTRNRHYGARNMRVRNVFAVERPDRDAKFVKAVQDIAAKRKGTSPGNVLPELQPAKRPDLGDISDYVKDANVFLGIHGTRSVNVSPILASHFRMPKSLSGVPIAGAAFGHGVYFADDRGKSAGYVGSASALYGSGGGVAGRGNFMFLCDVVGGKHFYPTGAWGIDDKCPGGGDSVFAHPSRCSSLQNNEYVIFDPNQARIRYVVEVDI